MSPLTLKSTYVLDEKLSNEGAFGVVPGERSRHELGVLIQTKWEKEIFKNVAMVNDLDLYSDYMNGFGNIDVDWQINFDFKVNNFIRATFGSHIRYDDDVKIKKPTDIEGEFEESGAKVQWKQFLGIGFAVDF